MRPLVPLAGGGWFVRVGDASTAAEAERCLWAGLGSAIDSRLDTALHRRLSRGVTRAAVALGIPPNAITVASGVVGLAAAAVMAHGDPVALVAGLLLYLAAVVLDHSDGEVARLTLTESAIGEWLDIAVDTAVHTALVLALGLAAAAATGGGAAAGVVAALGRGGQRPGRQAVAAGPADGHRRAGSSTPSPRATASTRCSCSSSFLRLVAPSWLPGLMIVVAVGSHAYWLARLVLSVRRGRAGGTRP